jgi:hypothetical protein
MVGAARGGTSEERRRSCAAASAHATLDLSIDVTYATILGSRLDVPPRLSATPQGDRHFLFVRDFNQWTSVAASVITLVAAFSYGLVFLRDRRRRAYGWFALQGIAGGTTYALTIQGAFQHLVGPLEGFMAWNASLGAYASVRFTHAFFDLGPVPRAWNVAFVLAILASLVVPSFTAHFWVVAHHEALVRAERLNDELRRQIAQRADTLAAALARASHAGDEVRMLDVGERLDGRYEVVRRVGEGGAGVVYEARRTSDGARLALKLLRGGADTTDMARFAREAQLIAKLDHPNVVRIVDLDVSRTGFFYLVVEFVEGLSLSQHRARFGDVKWAVNVLGQVAAGLSAIHTQGIVHRDLKPGNVLVRVDSEGVATVKIADFGIAAVSSALEALSCGERTLPDPRSDLTTTGAWIGTPRYMAPELAEGAKAADRASDVFSFGVIAYEVLTATFPYEGSAALLRLRGEEYKPPASLRGKCPKLDGAIAEVIDRCFAERPDERPDAATLARVLRGHDAEAAE